MKRNRRQLNWLSKDIWSVLEAICFFFFYRLIKVATYLQCLGQAIDFFSLAVIKKRYFKWTKLFFFSHSSKVKCKELHQRGTQSKAWGFSVHFTMPCTFPSIKMAKGMKVNASQLLAWAWHGFLNLTSVIYEFEWETKKQIVDELSFTPLAFLHLFFCRALGLRERCSR